MVDSEEAYIGRRSYPARDDDIVQNVLLGVPIVGFRVGDSLSIHCKLQQLIQEHNFGWGESWESESFVNR